MLDQDVLSSLTPEAKQVLGATAQAAKAYGRRADTDLLLEALMVEGGYLEWLLAAQGVTSRSVMAPVREIVGDPYVKSPHVLYIEDYISVVDLAIRLASPGPTYPEHILLALTYHPSVAQQVMELLEVDFEQLRADTATLIAALGSGGKPAALAAVVGVLQRHVDVLELVRDTLASQQHKLRAAVAARGGNQG